MNKRTRTPSYHFFPSLSRKTQRTRRVSPHGLSPLSAGESSKRGIVLSGGHIFIDTWEFFIRSLNCPSYSLDALASHLGLGKTVGMPYSKIPGLAAGDANTRSQLAAYCLDDSLLTLRLFEHGDIWTKLEEGEMGWMLEENRALSLIKHHLHHQHRSSAVSFSTSALSSSSSSSSSSLAVFRLPAPATEGVECQFLCFVCKEVGHSAKECPSRACYNCGDRAHTFSDCPNRLTCYQCKQAGHIAKDCKQTRCYSCGLLGHAMRQCPSLQCCHCHQHGHLAADCPTNICFACGGSGHVKKDCKRGVRCYKCKRTGHYAIHCHAKPPFSTPSPKGRRRARRKTSPPLTPEQQTKIERNRLRAKALQAAKRRKTPTK